MYLEYAKAVGLLLSVIIILLYGCQSAAAIGANIWLSQWTNDEAMNRTTEKVHMRVGVYAALGIAQGKKLNKRHYLISVVFKLHVVLLHHGAEVSLFL